MRWFVVVLVILGVVVVRSESVFVKGARGQEAVDGLLAVVKETHARRRIAANLPRDARVQELSQAHLMLRDALHGISIHWCTRNPSETALAFHALGAVLFEWSRAVRPIDWHPPRPNGLQTGEGRTHGEAASPLHRESARLFDAALLSLRQCGVWAGIAASVPNAQERLLEGAQKTAAYSIAGAMIAEGRRKGMKSAAASELSKSMVELVLDAVDAGTEHARGSGHPYFPATQWPEKTVEKEEVGNVSVVTLCAYDAGSSKVTMHSCETKRRLRVQENLELRMDSKGLDPTRHPAWAKFPAVLRRLDSERKWAMWLDCDTFITNSSLSLTNLIPHDSLSRASRAAKGFQGILAAPSIAEALGEAEPASIIISADAVSVNTGAWLARNTPFSKAFLTHIYAPMFESRFFGFERARVAGNRGIQKGWPGIVDAEGNRIDPHVHYTPPYLPGTPLDPRYAHYAAPGVHPFLNHPNWEQATTQTALFQAAAASSPSLLPSLFSAELGYGCGEGGDDVEGSDEVVKRMGENSLLRTFVESGAVELAWSIQSAGEVLETNSILEAWEDVEAKPKHPQRACVAAVAAVAAVVRKAVTGAIPQSTSQNSSISLNGRIIAKLASPITFPTPPLPHLKRREPENTTPGATVTAHTIATTKITQVAQRASTLFVTAAFRKSPHLSPSSTSKPAFPVASMSEIIADLEAAQFALGLPDAPGSDAGEALAEIMRPGAPWSLQAQSRWLASASKGAVVIVPQRWINAYPYALAECAKDRLNSVAHYPHSLDRHPFLQPTGYSPLQTSTPTTLPADFAIAFSGCNLILGSGKCEPLMQHWVEKGG